MVIHWNLFLGENGSLTEVRAEVMNGWWGVENWG